MTSPLHSRPYSPATFAAAFQAWPQIHPLSAAMRALGSGPRPVFTAAELTARRDRELAFWAGLPGAAEVRARIGRRYAETIAAAERREARAARVTRIEAALDDAEAALPGPHRLREAQQVAEVDRVVVSHAEVAAVATDSRASDQPPEYERQHTVNPDGSQLNDPP